MLLDYDRKKQYFEALERLIEKQKVFYARIELSDDPEAKSVKETMNQGIVMLGATPDTPMQSMFDELQKKISIMRDKLEEDNNKK